MRLFKFLVGLLFVFLAMMVIAPLVSKWYLVKHLENNGYQASIKGLSFDYVHGVVTFRDLQLQSQQGEKLKAVKIEVNFDHRTLFSDNIIVQRLMISNLDTNIDVTDGKLTLAGLGFGHFLDDKNLHVQFARLEFIQLCRAGTQQCLKFDEAVLSGVGLNYQNGWSVIHQGPARFNKLFLVEPNRNAALFFAEQIQFVAGQWSQKRIAIGEVSCNNCQLNGSAPASDDGGTIMQTQIGKLNISSVLIELGDKFRVSLGKVEATSLRQILTNPLSKADFTFSSGLDFWMPPLFELFSNPDDKQIQLTVVAINLTDGALAWADYTVAPAAVEQATQFKLVTGRINTDDPSLATHVQTSFHFGLQGLTKFEGDVFPGAENFALVGEGIIQDLQLANFAGYSEKLLDAKVLSGVVDVGFKLSYRDRVLEGDTLWRIAQLRMIEPPEKGKKVPMAFSFDLLQDHNQSVPFDLPIRFEASQGQLNLKYLFIKIREKLNQLVAQELNPAGKVSIKPAAGGDTKMEFQPLHYATQAREPKKEDKQRLDEIVNLLKGKEHLSMVFCPITTGGEWAEIFGEGQMPEPEAPIPAEQSKLLIQLAKTRGLMLQTLLIEKGLALKQIVICGPTVDLTQTGPSYITIAM